MNELVINAEGQILGRLAAFVAKQALLGNKVVVANSEKALVSGNKKSTLEEYKIMVQKGDVNKGPFFPRAAERIVQRTIRGMLPYKIKRGRDAFERVKCVKGPLPEMITIKVNKFSPQKYITIEELSKLL